MSTQSNLIEAGNVMANLLTTANFDDLMRPAMETLADDDERRVRLSAAFAEMAAVRDLAVDNWLKHRKFAMNRFPSVYHDFQPTIWSRVSFGDTVYIDNWQSGEFPLADPKISGPYLVNDRKNHYLFKMGSDWRAIFMHYPNNLLVEKAEEDNDGLAR